MPEVPDFRVQCNLFDHPKWIRLEARSPKACMALLKLWAWARANRPVMGDFKGMTIKEIEHVARWRGRKGTLVQALLDIVWMDEEDGVYYLHDWRDWQGYATGSAARSRAGKIGAIIKQCRRLNVHPDDYLDDAGGHDAQDSDLRARLRHAWEAKSRKQKAVRTHSDRTPNGAPSDANACAPSDPDPDPNGEGGKGGSPGSGFGSGSVGSPPCPSGFAPEQWERRCSGKSPRGFRSWLEHDQHQARASGSSIQAWRRSHSLDPDDGSIRGYWRKVEA